MSKEIKLPSGATVTLKDPKELRIKDRKRVIEVADSETTDLKKAMVLGDAIIAMLVTDWSFDYIIPSVKIDSLGELEIADYDALVDATKDAQKFLFPNLSETDENAQDPKAPSAN
jgi:hypothetical protein